jgi:hypothetical protein
LQVFGPGTNIIPQSQATTGWTTTNATFAAGASRTAPDGISAALVITDNSTSGEHSVTSGSFSVTAQSYVISVFVQAGTCAQPSPSEECRFGAISGVGTAFTFGINFDAVACTVVGGSTSVVKALPPKRFANGSCRIGFIGTAFGSASVNIKIAMANGLSSYNATPSYTGAGSTMLIWGLDVKAGSTLLPYCPTSGSSATCGGDQIVATNQLKTTLEGSALRVVAQTAEFYESQPPLAATVLGLGSALTGLGISNGTTTIGTCTASPCSNYTAQMGWPSTAATLITAGQIIRYQNTNYIGLSADSSGRSLALNGQTAVSDSNGLSSSSSEHIGSLSSGAAYCNCVISRLTLWNTRNDAAMLTATNNSAVLPLIASYNGAVANHTRINDLLDASTVAMARSHHRATENITSLQVEFGNYYVPQSGPTVETSPGAATTITASVEYPAGTCHTFTFGGNSFGTIPNGGVLLTDPNTVTIPAGADFWIRDYLSNSSGLVVNMYVSAADTHNGDKLITRSPTDQTANCTTMSGGTAGYLYYPDAIVGPTQLHSYCLEGDSRLSGYNDVPNDSLDAVGQVERWVVPYYSVINIGLGGDRANKFIASHTNRIGLWKYCSGVIIELGGGDIYFGHNSAAKVEGWLKTIYRYNSYLNGGSGPVWITTIAGDTTSSNNWLTVAGQTLSAVQPVGAEVNRWMRSSTASSVGVPNYAGYFETANPVQTAQDSGYWCVTAVPRGCTFDGLHPSPYGYNLDANSFGSFGMPHLR